MDKSMQILSATLAGLSLHKMNTSITHYGQPTLPRIATTYTLNDLHEHLGQHGLVWPDEPDRAAVEQENRGREPNDETIKNGRAFCGRIAPPGLEPKAIFGGQPGLS